MDSTANAVAGDALWDEVDYGPPVKHLILEIIDGTTLSCKTPPSAEGAQQAKIKRYYNGSTPITDWEADLDDTGLYTSGDDAVGECWNDAVFDEAVTINDGGTVTLNSIKLTVASGERHDGTDGSGARIVMSASGSPIIQYNVDITGEVEWLEIDGNHVNGTQIGFGADGTHSSVLSVRQLLIQGCESGAATVKGLSVQRTTNAHDIVIWDLLNTRNTGSGSGICRGIDNSSSGRTARFQNITLHDITKDNGSAAAQCVENVDATSNTYQNIIATDPGGTTSGSKVCFAVTSPASSTEDHNLASDATANGTDSLDSKASSDQFVSNSAPYDLHLKTGADAKDAGTDLGTAPSGVETDIDGFDRNADATYDPWDMGAHELQAAAGLGIPIAAYHHFHHNLIS